MSDGEFQIPEELRAWFPQWDEAEIKSRITPLEEFIKQKPENMTGIEKIAQERLEQKIKHNHTIKNDFENYKKDELRQAARKLIHFHRASFEPPEGWDPAQWDIMIQKSNEERLIIAGALIAAEIDRLNFKE